MSLVDGYYVPNEILTMKDANGRDPIFRIITGNRTAGKSFGVKNHMVTRALKTGREFGIIGRHKIELPLVPASFAEDLREVKPRFSDFVLTRKPIGNSSNPVYDELYYKDDRIGFTIPLVSASLIKKASSAFVGADEWLFDEFQLEDPSGYLRNEGDLLYNVAVSIARGGGKHVRPITIFLVSNTYSIFNPIFTHFGIHKLLKPDTKFLRGDGWVLEQMYNPDAAEALKSGGLSGGNGKEARSSIDNVYILDTDAFIGKIKGKKRLMFTVVHNDHLYGVHTCGSLVYVSDSAPSNFPIRFAITPDEHNVSTTLIGKSSPYKRWLLSGYESASIRFESPLGRDAIMTLLGLI